MKLPCDPAILLLDIYAKKSETLIQKNRGVGKVGLQFCVRETESLFLYYYLCINYCSIYLCYYYFISLLMIHLLGSDGW